MAGGINAIGNLLGKVDANGALLVALDGTSPATASRFFGDASATLPAFSITGDTDTGFGASAANTAAIWAGGTTPRVSVSSTAVTSTVPGVFPVGTVSATGINLGTAGTGLYQALGTSQIGFATDGSQVAMMSSNGTVGVQVGFGFPLTFSSTADGSARDVSLSRGAANRLDLATGDSFNVVSGSYMAGGVSGVATFGPSVVTSITVKNGIVTAIS